MADHLKKIESYISAFGDTGELAVDIEGEVATITLPSKFIETLPEGITEDLAKKYEAHKAGYVTAGAHIGGSRGNQIFEANPEVKRVEIHAPLFGKQYFDVIGHRESGEGKSHKYGDYVLLMHTEVEDGGTLAKVFKYLSSDAKERLNKTTESK